MSRNEYNRKWYRKHPEMKDYHNKRMKQKLVDDPLFNKRKFFKSNADILKTENYDIAFTEGFKNWDVHHRLEFTINGEYAHSAAELKRLGMYYRRPYFELIFLRHEEHTSLHKKKPHGIVP